MGRAFGSDRKRTASVGLKSVFGVSVGWTASLILLSFIASSRSTRLGFTSFHVLWINRNFLPAELRPRWYSQIGIACCGIL